LVWAVSAVNGGNGGRPDAVFIPRGPPPARRPTSRGELLRPRAARRHDVGSTGDSPAGTRVPESSRGRRPGRTSLDTTASSSARAARPARAGSPTRSYGRLA